jgi:hypothetical protein
MRSAMMMACIMIMLIMILFGGCSKTKQIWAGPSITITVPEEIGYHIYNEGWISLEKLEAEQPSKLLWDGIMMKMTADNIIKVKNGKLLIARCLTPTQQHDPSTKNEAVVCFIMYKVELDRNGNVVNIDMKNKIARKDMCKYDDAGDPIYLLFEFQIPSSTENIVYWVDLGDHGGSIVVQ